MTKPKPMKTRAARLPADLDAELERRAAARNMTASDAMREGTELWLRYAADSEEAQERWDAWARALIERHGSDAALRVEYDSMRLLDARTVVGAPQVTGEGSGVIVTINGELAPHVAARAAVEASDPRRRWDSDRAVIWIGDPRSDGLRWLGALPAHDGAALTMPLDVLATLTRGV